MPSFALSDAAQRWHATRVAIAPEQLRVPVIGAAATLALVLVACNRSDSDQTSAPAPAAAAAAPEPHVAALSTAKMAIAKPLKDWELRDLERAMKAGGFTITVTQDATGDDGGGTTHRHLRVVATWQGEHVAVNAHSYAGDNSSDYLDMGEKNEDCAAVHRANLALLCIESKNEKLANTTAAALLGSNAGSD